MRIREEGQKLPEVLVELCKQVTKLRVLTDDELPVLLEAASGGKEIFCQFIVLPSAVRALVSLAVRLGSGAVMADRDDGITIGQFLNIGDTSAPENLMGGSGIWSQEVGAHQGGREVLDYLIFLGLDASDPLWDLRKEAIEELLGSHISPTVVKERAELADVELFHPDGGSGGKLLPWFLSWATLGASALIIRSNCIGDSIS